MPRIDKLYALLQNTLSLENGLRLPKRADRFVALEQSESGDTLWAYFGKDFDAIKRSLEESETSFVGRVRVHDLATDRVFVPVWKIVDFVEIHV